MEKKEDSELLKTFGKNLRKIRKAKGFTQAMLANDVGVEISQISRIERGVINTSILMLYKISKVLKIEPGELVKF
ncbi:MAG TPA: helix-turn-helix transcriptional regulator [Aequorivita sp.]|nr:helix-turn-helix transcriptional regulator [Aequorivita sp.]